MPAKKSPATAATTEKAPAAEKDKKPKVTKKKAVAAKPKAEGEKGKKRTKKHSNSYTSYIYKVLKQVHPDTGE
jgi:histone H2B